MKLKAVLLAAVLAPVLASAAATAGAGESGAEKAAATNGAVGANPPAKEHKLDFKELFGCEPMGEDGHPMSHEAAEKNGSEEVVQAEGADDPVK